MINTVSLDTSVLVRILTKDKPEDCRKALNFLNQGLEFIVEDIALSETIYVLETIYDKSREEIIDLVNFFLTRYADKIEYNHELTSLVFPFYLTHPKISFNDCYLASCAEIKGAEPLMTFDKKLASQHPPAKLLA